MHFQDMLLIAKSTLFPIFHSFNSTRGYNLTSEEYQFWREYDAEQASETRMKMVLAASIIKLVGALCGIFGCISIIYMCRYKKLLNRNTIGLLICIIAYLDIISSCYYIQQAIKDLPQFNQWFVDHFLFQFIFEILMSWSLISYSFIGLLLSLHTLFVVRYSGTTSHLDKFKWGSIFVCFLFPFLLYFLPLHYMIHAEVFDVNPICVQNAIHPCSNLKVISSTLMITIIATVVFLTLCSYMLVLWSLKRNIQEKRNYSRSCYMIYFLKQLGTVFSFCILLIWVPYMLRFVLVNIIESSYDEKHFMKFDFVTFAIFCRNFFMPLRGYFHALSLLYVFKASFKKDQNLFWQYLQFTLFLSPIATKEELIERYRSKSTFAFHFKESLVETAKTISLPHWTIQEGTVTYCPTPVIEKRVWIPSVTTEAREREKDLDE